MGWPDSALFGEELRALPGHSVRRCSGEWAVPDRIGKAAGDSAFPALAGRSVSRGWSTSAPPLGSRHGDRTSPNPPATRALGAELRKARTQAGLTVRALAGPAEDAHQQAGDLKSPRDIAAHSKAVNTLTDLALSESEFLDLIADIRKTMQG